MLVKMPVSAGQGVLEMLQQRYPGYHPLIAIADIANSGAASEDIKLQFDCHKTIAEYVLPKLRAVEHSGEVNNSRRVIVQLFQDNIEDAQLVTDTTPSAQQLIQATQLEQELIPANLDDEEPDLISIDALYD